MTLGHLRNSMASAHNPDRPRLSPLLAAQLRRTAGFGLRATRSIYFRARKIFSLHSLRLIRRNLLFPLRNVLLRHKPLSVQAGGQKYLLVPEGAIPLDMWAGGYFEKHELEFLLTVLRPGMTFVDVGANVGLFCVPAARKVAHGKVFAFEPASWTFERLIRNIELNKITNLHPIRSALGDYTGEAVLQINVSGKDGLNTIGKPTHPDSEVVATEVVPITTLDNFLRQHAVTHVDVMKIDSEGAELFVFRGAAELLSRVDAPLILYENGPLTKGFGYHPVETMWLLEHHGYSLFVIDPKGRILTPSSAPACDTNLIAVKASHPLYATVKELVR